MPLNLSEIRNVEPVNNEKLNREVARYEGVEFTDENDPYPHELMQYDYCTNPSLSQPILERERVCVAYDKDWAYDPETAASEGDNGDRWMAWIDDSDHCYYGPTMLVAGMRCHVSVQQRKRACHA